MSKQDRQGVRTPADLERKYNFDKRFAEIMGIANDARDSVEKVESTLRDEMKNQVTSITRDTEQIIMSALEEYVRTGDFETYKETVSAEIAVMADKVSISVSETVRNEVNSASDQLQAQINEIRMNYDFGPDGQYIGKKDSDTMLRLVNDMMQILVSGVAATTVDKTGLTADEANIKTIHMGDYTLALGEDGHLMLT